MGLRDGTLTPDDVGTKPMVRLETSSGSTNINQSILFPWDSAPMIDSGFSYTAGNDYITVDNGGTYCIHFNIGWGGGYQRDSPNARLFKNRTTSGSGGTQLSASGKSGYVREADNHQESSLSLSWMGELSSGDTVAIQMSREANSGSRTPQTDECNMVIRREVV